MIKSSVYPQKPHIYSSRINFFKFFLEKTLNFLKSPTIYKSTAVEENNRKEVFEKSFRIQGSNKDLKFREEKIMRIQHNIAALNAHRQLTNNNSMIGKNLEKLSSGYRINRAGDDAAGLAISEKMRAQIQGLETAQKNAQDGISLVQTAEGALTEVHSMLNRMVELATQSANGTYDTSDRASLQAEVDSLLDEIDRIAENTNFNGINLLDGSMEPDTVTSTAVGGFALEGLDASITSVELVYADGTAATDTTDGSDAEVTAAVSGGILTITVTGAGIASTAAGGGAAGDALSEAAFKDAISGAVGSVRMTGAYVTPTADVSATITEVEGDALNLQVGDTADPSQKVSVGIRNMDAQSLGIADVDITTEEGADKAIGNIKIAITSVSSTRGDLGAIQNRLEHTINNLGVTSENMTAAESRIRDVDMAAEMMAFTKNNILVQASQSMLSQANMIPQGVLQLLG